MATQVRRLHLNELREQLRAFEERYLIASSAFFDKYNSGELPDSRDFIRWAAIYRMHQASVARRQVRSRT